MVGVRDNLQLAVDAINAYKLRAALTVLGLTMGVATLMTVMTLVQGANLYVEQRCFQRDSGAGHKTDEYR